MFEIVGYYWQWPSPTDLAFMFKYRSDGAGATFTVQQVTGGGYDPSHPDKESNLNIQYAEAMAYPTSIIIYSTSRTVGPEGRSEWFLQWLGYIFDQGDIPQTISISYGYPEDDVSRGFAMNVCNKFARLGLRGVSVLFPSGDDGVGEGVTDNGSVQFAPYFPASCACVAFFLGLKTLH